MVRRSKSAELIPGRNVEMVTRGGEQSPLSFLDCILYQDMIILLFSVLHFSYLDIIFLVCKLWSVSYLDMTHHQSG